MQQKNKLGFSLVELIVVIAIMAVMVGVLAPALLNYVESSRKQTDDSNLGELTNAIKLCANQEKVYDEILHMIIRDNYAYYDLPTATEDTTKTNPNVAQEKYKNGIAETHEIKGALNGTMRGVTLTYSPYDKEIVIGDGIVNIGADSATVRTDPIAIGTRNFSQGADVNGKKLSEVAPTMTAFLNETMGEKIIVRSATYRNANYTIFMQMTVNDSTTNAMVFYGQWDGQGT